MAVPKVSIQSKIVYKGLVYILVPCIFDSICCLGLYDLELKSEKMTAEEQRIVEIATFANAVMGDYAAAAGQITNYLTTRNTAALKKGHTYLKVFDSKFEKLIPLLEDQPAELKAMKVYRDTGKKMLEDLEAMGRQTGDGSGGFDSMMDSYNLLKSRGLSNFIWRIGHTSDDVMSLAMQQQSRLERVRAEHAVNTKRTKQIVILAIIANFLVALAAGFLFLKDITARLSVLVENARRLPKLLPLNEKVKGKDELTYLDQAIHDASLELRTSTEQRQYLMQMVAHDIRSPLMSSQIALDVLNDPRIGVMPTMVSRQIMTLGRSIQRLTALTNDLLTMDKLEAGRLDVSLESTDVYVAIDETIDSLHELAKKRNIELVNESEHLIIPADKLRLSQVLTNLISNAIKFSPNDAPIKINATHEPDFVTITILDKGPGIPLEHQDKIFDKYAQLDNGIGKGFGLGLAICKLIVDAHGGTIGVRSKPKNGACFWFRLPMQPLSHEKNSNEEPAQRHGVS